ncbi:hypothetical protein [Salinicoccus albus]|uniref:hypothetical protein n=1 Tax=Salinicoccus albus TaxID=418756 RepID=UPI000372079C|nr:hypothetical protein [Salinicoccus albus]
METIDLTVLILLIIVFILFIISRKQLKHTGLAVSRQKRMKEMMMRTHKYDREGFTKKETIEHLKTDFNLGDEEAVYLYERAKQQRD